MAVVADQAVAVGLTRRLLLYRRLALVLSRMYELVVEFELSIVPMRDRLREIEFCLWRCSEAR